MSARFSSLALPFVLAGLLVSADYVAPVQSAPLEGNFFSPHSFTRFAQRPPVKKPAATARFETIVYKAWRVNCNTDPKVAKSNKPGCSAIRQLKDGKTGRLIFGWIIARNTKKQIVSVLQIPTGGVAFKNIGTLTAISVEKGVKVKVGEVVQSFNFGACTIGICEATGAFNRRLHQSLRKPGDVIVTFYTNQGKDINFTFKDDGLGQAIGRLERQ